MDTSPAAIKAWALSKAADIDNLPSEIRTWLGDDAGDEYEKDGKADDAPDAAMFRAVAALADLEAEAAAEIARLRARPTWAQGVEAAAAEVVRLRMEFCNDRYATQPEGSRGERVACNWIEAAIRALKEPT